MMSMERPANTAPNHSSSSNNNNPLRLSIASQHSSSNHQRNSSNHSSTQLAMSFFDAFEQQQQQHDQDDDPFSPIPLVEHQPLKQASSLDESKECSINSTTWTRKPLERAVPHLFTTGGLSLRGEEEMDVPMPLAYSDTTRTSGGGSSDGVDPSLSRFAFSLREGAEPPPPQQQQPTTSTSSFVLAEGNQTNNINNNNTVATNDMEMSDRSSASSPILSHTSLPPPRGFGGGAGGAVAPALGGASSSSALYRQRLRQDRLENNLFASSSYHDSTGDFRDEQQLHPSAAQVQGNFNFGNSGSLLGPHRHQVHPPQQRQQLLPLVFPYEQHQLRPGETLSDAALAAFQRSIVASGHTGAPPPNLLTAFAPAIPAALRQPYQQHQQHCLDRRHSCNDILQGSIGGGAPEDILPPALLHSSEPTISLQQATANPRHGSSSSGISMLHDSFSSLGTEGDEDEEGGDSRFKPFHEEKWAVRYKELVNFHRENGHSAVPHTYPPNPQLARWVKRQRRQCKLLRENKPSTMTYERLELLNMLGFIWDSHEVNWREKIIALDKFRLEHGHCNVPSNHVDKKLATWVKCQRRQYKLYCDGKGSAMCPKRIKELEGRGFEWEIRSSSSKTAGGSATGQSPKAGEEDSSLPLETLDEDDEKVPAKPSSQDQPMNEKQ